MTTVVMWADRWPEMLGFYRSLLLDASPQPVSLDFVAVRGQESEVLLHRTPSEFLSDLSAPPSRRAEAAIKPVFNIDSIERVRAAGLPLTGQIAEHDGWSYCDLVDPDGNVLQVRWR